MSSLAWSEPVLAHDGWTIASTDERTELRGRLLPAIGAGWQPVGLLWLGGAGVVVDLRHESGRRAGWLLSPTLKKIGDIELLAESAKNGTLSATASAAAAAIGKVLQPICLAILKAEPSAGNALALGRLSRLVRRALLAVATPSLASVLVRFTVAAQTNDYPNLKAILGDESEALITRCVAAGRLVMPALHGPGETQQNLFVPVGGREPGGVMISNDAPDSPTWWSFRGKGCPPFVLLPDAVRAVVWDKADRPGTIDQINAMLMEAICLLSEAGDLPPAVRIAPKGMAAAVFHFSSFDIGHLLWDALCFPDRLLETPGLPLPTTVYDLAAGDPRAEIYGEFTQLFPEFAGRVRTDCATSDAAFLAACAAGQQLLMARYRRVSTSLRARVQGVVVGDEAAHARAAVETSRLGLPDKPAVLVLGLRLQSRSLEGMLDFYVALARRLEARLGRRPLAVVLDGLNVPPPSTVVRVHEVANIGDLLAREQAFVQAFRERLADRPIRIASCVGMDMRANLAVLQHAHFFVAPNGAGLVKLRWVMNMPGFVLTSAQNLRFSIFLDIYGRAGNMDDPTSLEYTRVDEVEDIYPEGQQFDAAGRTIEAWRGHLSLVNFRVRDWDGLSSRIEDLFDHALRTQ